MDGGLSDWFATVVGVLQGCILSPLLFNIFLEVVMALVLDGNEIGADINGKCISYLRFADDIFFYFYHQRTDLGGIMSITSVFTIGPFVPCSVYPPLQNPKYASDVNMPSQTK